MTEHSNIFETPEFSVALRLIYILTMSVFIDHVFTNKLLIEQKFKFNLIDEFI